MHPGLNKYMMQLRMESKEKENQGNLLAEVVCKLFHITDPIAKGVGIGTSAHAVGTSKALQMGEVEGAMSGLSIAVAGVLTAVLCPLFVGFIQ